MFGLAPLMKWWSGLLLLPRDTNMSSGPLPPPLKDHPLSQRKSRYALTPCGSCLLLNAQKLLESLLDLQA